jgi:hypothetical protein
MKRNFFFLCLVVSTLCSLSAEIYGGDPSSELFLENSHRQKKWGDYHSDKKISLRNVLDLLAQCQKGRELLHELEDWSRRQGKSLFDSIEAGEKSFTDTTIIREAVDDYQMVIKFSVDKKIYLDRNHSPLLAVLDLAHEITHFLYRRTVNPYVEKVDKIDFIKSTIEGRGGEVEAYLNECLVAKELGAYKFINNSNCRELEGQSEKSQRETIAKRFYKMGQGRSVFLEKLRDWNEKNGDLENAEETHQKLPWLSSEKVDFLAAISGEAYPMGILQEYQTMLEKACANEGRRVEFLLNKVRPEKILALRRPVQDYLMNHAEQIKNQHIEKCQNISLMN